MKYGRTTPQDAPGLKRLWAAAFGDGMTAIDGLFDRLDAIWMPFAAKEGETVAAMAFAVPMTVCRGEDSWPAAYLYAVATAEEYRNQGLCRGLLGHMEKVLKRKNFQYLLLSAADAKLAEAYGRMGFSGAAPVRGETPLPNPAGKAERCSAVEYASIRETLLWDRLHVRYPKAWLEAAADGTGLYMLQLGAALGCAAGRLEGDRLVLDEVLPGPELIHALARAEDLAAAKTVRLPPEGALMTKALQEGPPEGAVYGPIIME